MTHKESAVPRARVPQAQSDTGDDVVVVDTPLEGMNDDDFAREMERATGTGTGPCLDGESRGSIRQLRNGAGVRHFLHEREGSGYWDFLYGDRKSVV